MYIQLHVNTLLLIFRVSRYDSTLACEQISVYRYVSMCVDFKVTMGNGLEELCKMR